MLYMDGKGVPHDTVQGIALLRAAATQGFVEAQANLGILLASGRGVTRNDRDAAVWLGRAAKAGNKSAAKALRDLEHRKQ
jgi:TPR repeat protein